MGKVHLAHVAAGAPAAPLKAAARQPQDDQCIKALKGHRCQNGGAGRAGVSLGRDAADAAETLSAVAGQLKGGNLGLDRCTDPDADNLAAPIDVDTQRLSNFRADGC